MEIIIFIFAFIIGFAIFSVIGNLFSPIGALIDFIADWIDTKDESKTLSRIFIFIAFAAFFALLVVGLTE